MTKILDEILSICEVKIRDTILSVHCNIMHERDSRGIDYSIYSEILGNTYIVKSEIEFFKELIILITKSLELSFSDEWENPFIQNDFGGLYNDEDKKKDVYEYLLDKCFNENELLSMTSPSKFILPFIEQNFKMKSLMRVGLKKFFPNMQFKKIVKLPNGENLLQDYTEKDENFNITNNEINQIETITEFECFIENIKTLKIMLENKRNESDILVFIRDN